jgi:hypothetical protein
MIELVSRRLTAALIGIGVALLFPGLPILAFFASYRHPDWGVGTWVQVLLPNVLLLLLIGALAGGLYLFATRPRSSK